MEDKSTNINQNGELLQAGVNVHLDIPNSVWFYLGGTIIVSGTILILLQIFKKKI